MHFNAKWRGYAYLMSKSIPLTHMDIYMNAQSPGLVQALQQKVKVALTGATCRTGTANPSEISHFTPSFGGVPVAQSAVFCVAFC